MSQLSMRVKLSTRQDCFMRLYKKRFKIIIWGKWKQAQNGVYSIELYAVYIHVYTRKYIQR